MFERKTYILRRAQLKRMLGAGVVLLLGNDESPMNYPANLYPFWQDSSFLYYIGLNQPGLAAIIDVDNDRVVLFGDELTIDDVVWTGPQPTLVEQARGVGITETAPQSALADVVATERQRGRTVHFLPPYRGNQRLKLEALFGIRAGWVDQYVSLPLIDAVVAQREIKTDEEVAEIEQAIALSHAMHTGAMQAAKPGMLEQEVVGAVTGIMRTGGGHFSFPMIFSIHGETLHNHHYDNRMAAGDLIVHDSGTTSPNHYASDITRTIPVGGRFTAQQRPLYDLVLEAQLQAIAAMKPGVRYKDVHLLACRVLASGLKDAGLMRGDVDEAVAAGAHALFMPHGLGHMMGMDVHDMEGLGEDRVGYDASVKRSDQFGTAYLRLAKALQPGFVVTVEPGLYFIPLLIDQWKAEGIHADFINYDALDDYRDFGGIRIEDDVLVTADGYRVLGPPIPKTADEVEAVMAG